MTALTYQEDVPSRKPRFDAELVATGLADLLQQPAEGAVVLGVHGPWGCGKTTMLEAIEREIRKREAESVYIWFNAWKFQERQALWRALILHVLAELRSHGGDQTRSDELSQSLYRAFSVEEKGAWKIDWRSLIVEFIGLALSIVRLDFVAEALRESTGWFGNIFFRDKGAKSDKGDKAEDILSSERIEKIAGVLERETVQRQVLQVQSIEQFLDKYQELVASLTAGGRRIYVFIDDLDRCLPESALEIFEAIKLFLDAAGSRYVIALDRDVIRKGLSIRYGLPGAAAAGQLLIDPDEYIEKTIAISYDMLQLSSADALEILGTYELPVALDETHKQLIIGALGTNPRRVKRFMNTLALQARLAQLAKAPSFENPREFDLVLKLLIVSYRYSGVFSRMLVDNGLLLRLQGIANTYAAAIEKRDSNARATRRTALANDPSVLQALDLEEDFWRLMRLQPSFRDDAGETARLQAWFRNRTVS